MSEATLYEVTIVTRDGVPLLEGVLSKSALEEAILAYKLAEDRPHMVMVQAVAQEGFFACSNRMSLCVRQARN